MKIGRLLILVALILLIAMLAIFWKLRQSAKPGTPGASASSPAAQQTIPVVVAAQAIHRGTKITADMLTTVDLPADKVLQTQLTKPEQALGKRAVRDLSQGMFLTEGDVAEKLTVGSEGSLASLQIPPGSVALAIPLDRLSGVAYALQPGDHVAVIATFPFVDVDEEFQSILPDKVAAIKPPQASGGQESGPTLTAEVGEGSGAVGKTVEDETLGISLYAVPSEPQRARLSTQMLIKDAAVLYVGTFPRGSNMTLATAEEGNPQPQQGNKPQGQKPAEASAAVEQQNAPDVITLVVTPQEAVVLKYLLDRRVPFTLALRAGGDDSDLSTNAVTLSTIIDSYEVVVPSKLPYDLNPRIDKVLPTRLRGDAVATMPPQ